MFEYLVDEIPLVNVMSSFDLHASCIMPQKSHKRINHVIESVLEDYLRCAMGRTPSYDIYGPILKEPWTFWIIIKYPL